MDLRALKSQLAEAGASPGARRRFNRVARRHGGRNVVVNEDTVRAVLQGGAAAKDLENVFERAALEECLAKYDQLEKENKQLKTKNESLEKQIDKCKEDLNAASWSHNI